MRYIVAPIDEWAVVNHPWQPATQHLHVLVAPLLVFAVGLIWSVHILGRLKNGRTNKIAGIGLTALFSPMVVSGYMLQVAVDPAWRLAWVWVHGASSLLWVAAFVAHQVVAWSSKSNRDLAAEVQALDVTPFRLSAPTRRADQVEVSSGPQSTETILGEKSGTETETETGTG